MRDSLNCVVPAVDVNLETAIATAAASMTEVQRPIESAKPTPRSVLVKFEGNSNRKWDGKIIQVESSWLEELYGSNLQQFQPGQKLTLPWETKDGKKTQLWNVTVVEVQQEPAEPTATTSGKRKRTKSRTCIFT